MNDGLMVCYAGGCLTYYLSVLVHASMNLIVHADTFSSLQFVNCISMLKSPSLIEASPMRSVGKVLII